ncbi:MAG: pyrroline-5-carboxylate reductase [Pseudomonadota bacterium]
MHKLPLSLGFVGAGKMTCALLDGLLGTGFPRNNICISNPHEVKLKQLKARYGIQTTPDNSVIPQKSNVVILSVKPQDMKVACTSLRNKEDPTNFAENTMFISIAAGITIHQLQDWLKTDAHPIVRAMPNTPAQVCKGATGLFSSSKLSHKQKQMVNRIFQGVGISAWLPNEAALNVITALSGSGPAYHFYWIECMIAAGIKLGLEPRLAEQFAIQTAYGAAEMAHRSPDLRKLRQDITLPGGTTAAALKEYKKALPNIVETGVRAAYDRSETMSAEQITGHTHAKHR